MVTGSLTVLYDADCGVCTATARILRRLDRRGRLSMVPLQTATRADAPTFERLLDSLHAVDEQGRWWVGADAVIEIGRRIPTLRLFTVAVRLPFARPVIDATYRLITRNRHRLSRALGMSACDPGGGDRALGSEPGGERRKLGVAPGRLERRQSGNWTAPGAKHG